MRNIILLSSFHKYKSRSGEVDLDENGIQHRFYRGLCFERYRNVRGTGLSFGVEQTDIRYPFETMRWGLYADQYEVLKE